MREGLFRSYFGAIAVPIIDKANGQASQVTHEWADAMSNLGAGLAVTVLKLKVRNQSVGRAKQILAEQALANNCDWILYVDDDVLPPPNGLLKMIQLWKSDPKYKIINGVYWSKSEPPQPLIFKGSFEGAYFDWHVGDLIEADAAGAGFTFIDTDVFRGMPKPWFSTNYFYDDPREQMDLERWQQEDEMLNIIRNNNEIDENKVIDLAKKVNSFSKEMVEMKDSQHIDNSLRMNKEASAATTEDLYFYKKAKDILGLSCWVDTSIQCGHQDKSTGHVYSIRPDFPQFSRENDKQKPQDKKLLDIGSGLFSPYHNGFEVTRLDIDPKVKPDIIADARHLPINDNEYDVVFASHVLEHFTFRKTKSVLKEWIRVLKPGGELRIVVPNLEWAAERILQDGENPELFASVLNMFYSAQKDGGHDDIHKAGFTPASIYHLFNSMKHLDNVRVKTSNGNFYDWNKRDNDKGNYNIIVTANKVGHDMPVSIHKNTSVAKQELENLLLGKQ